MSDDVKTAAGSSAQDAMRASYRWKKVEVPKSWRPSGVGDELVGFYAGRTKKGGKFGQYEVLLVMVPSVGMLMVSGAHILQLIDAAYCPYGQPIRILYTGLKSLSKNREMKQFDLFLCEGPGLPEAAIPSAQ